MSVKGSLRHEYIKVNIAGLMFNGSHNGSDYDNLFTIYDKPIKIDQSSLRKASNQLKKELGTKLSFEIAKWVSAEGKKQAEKLKKCIQDRTPHEKSSGTLYRGWKVYSKNRAPYIIKNTTNVISKQFDLSIDNKVPYAGYVEYGHRIVRNELTVGYVRPVYMMHNGANAYEATMDIDIKRDLDIFVSSLSGTLR